MEVLNAARIAPASFHRPPASSAEKRPEPRKLLPLNLPKVSTFDAEAPGLADGVPRRLRGGLALLSSVLGCGGLARALTYEEALQQSLGTSTSFRVGSYDIDVGEVLDGFLRFASENPVIVRGGAAVLAVSLILSQVVKKSKPWGVESAKVAYDKLSEDAGAQLLDIRELKDFKEVGSPDLRKLKKRAVSITYRGDDKPGFLKKLSVKFKDPGNTTLFILDKFDGNSELVAELATTNGFKAAFVVKGGAEGTRGWVNSGLPWSPPKKTLDIGDLTDSISGALAEGIGGLPVTVGLAAVTGLGFLAFSEMETVLQLLGSAALIQFITKKLLFAEDRKATLQQLDEFLNTKVAPKELVDEIKMIGKAFLPDSTDVKASLSASADPSTGTTSVTQAEKTGDVPKVNPELKVETAAEPPQEINSVPNAEVSSESISGTSRPLSPYPYYPDFKPPSSPSPSPP
uniref:Protein THYLAKOID RHODANESE-LIKE, chloroplastic n=1 Tax=Anthurium amnicola TaxID=1678845 RepID=A0A1D1YTR8_9ARAE